MTTNTAKFLNVGEVADITGISTSTLNKYRMISHPDAPPSFKVGNRVLYPALQLNVWAEQRLARASAGAQ